MLSYEEIQNNLEQFIGTEKWYRVYKDVLITDGVKYFSELSDDSAVIITVIIALTDKENLFNEWQFINIIVEQDKENPNKRKITMYSEPDLNEPHFWDYEYITSKRDDSLPEGKYKIWFQNNVLLLPSEY